MNEELNEQQQCWEEKFSQTPDVFGIAASQPAQISAGLFRKEGLKRILELGGGQGRDTLFFARTGFQVEVLDYCEKAVTTITEKVKRFGLAGSVSGRQHDVREPLPFEDETFDACFSHMLFSMALTTSELEQLSREVHRVLRPGALSVYTVRHTGDPHYSTGIHRGEDLYQTDQFIVHFFSREKVEQLAEGYELISIDEFEEGELPRKLFRVTLRKG